ncbi:pre-mRNA-splicing factor SLU7 [Schistocerca serialis cubense]|uniref:pre-mRNA-splicing factor SLU7 n=1 Tax=Schistocerca serialis cubense TaxID=2023355 RepID=UPI00214E7FF4|nr:pre-mRNA-splicing factor SLU7 [Schistocerca serialis cubense]XP_049959538.1 pre-mRNA-splicing factor SLU7 [Schistocerca serialis cubense]XP_049959539.1 pre-mRNA-splicing factor SLU7 [Schistocerca serialis cubense]
MAATQNVPVSEIIRNKSSGDDEPKKKSREDWRKAKELEEARKAGTAPAAVDEEGKDINPHIPQYISQAPWYFGSKGPTLKHQRPQPEREKQFARVDDWYKRGVSTNAAIKYRKGACENCGAMTHKKKDCMERPRRVGAKFTGTNIAPDEFIQPELSMDYDGKRDRWAGYDPSEHKSIIEEYQKIEEAKRQLRAEKLNSNVDGNAETEDIDEDDEDKYVDEVDMPGTKVDSKQRITVRNLRIREDTAKYLRNLDPNSAYYDPKTRSMRDNPHAGTGVNEQDVDYAGENFVRFTGDTQKHSVAQLFAWEAYEKGVDVHLLAEPTKLEMLQHEYEKKKEQFKSQAQGSILEKYGGAEHLQAPPKALLLAQTEDYVEYSRYGKLIKGQEKQIIRSKYEEDIFPNNHTSVWGSYWQNGQWGYKCCHSFVKNSYCTGEAGKAAASDLQRGMKVETEPLAEAKNSSSSDSDSSDSDDHSDKDSEETEKKKKQNKKKKKKEKKKKHLEKKRKGKKDSPEDKLKMALQQEDLNQQEAERILSMDERKRPYNSMFEVKKPTEEEIEAYYMKKRRDEDPMTQFMK